MSTMLVAAELESTMASFSTMPTQVKLLVKDVTGSQNMVSKPESHSTDGETTQQRQERGKCRDSNTMPIL